MEKLAKIKQDEFKREEASMVPLRHYLMAHVVPTLTKGLIEVTRARPADPVEFLVSLIYNIISCFTYVIISGFCNKILTHVLYILLGRVSVPKQSWKHQQHWSSYLQN